MSIQQSPIIENSVIFYRMLLYLYPKEHREEYDWLMVQLFRDKAYDAYRHDGRIGIVLHWLSALLDLFISVINEHREKGFTMSFNFLGKLRSPFIILGGILLALSAYGQLKPYPWYIQRPLYDAADSLMIPAFFCFGIGLLGLLISNRQTMPKISQLALAGATVVSLSLSITAILENSVEIPFWSDNSWYLFVVLMFINMSCLIAFSISMIRTGYRFAILFLLHPSLMLIMFIIGFIQEFRGQTVQSDVGPYWDMFFITLSWGIIWIIAGYILRKDLISQKEKLIGNNNFAFDQIIEGV